ncbi:MAG TPA: T9SS C-terminal target domain-containing protein [Verrucomicrobiota bacterium]|nr:T9SS C-terminal target domain-containing protein [Verrucomicrobiota bacterium]
MIRFSCHVAVATALAGLLLSLPAPAQEIKVDINNNNRPIAEGTDPAYTPWSTNSSWFPSGANAISNTFNGVTVTFTRVGPNGTALAPGYWKDGVQNPSYDARLTGDGIKVDGADAGAQIEMRLSGLTPGSHSLLTYHNDWDNHTPANVAPLNIFVNGVQAVTNLPITVRVTSTPAAASAYLGIEAVEGQDVVVLFAAETGTAAPIKNVYINGFEIDTANATLKAVNPSPRHADEHVDADDGSLLLSWTAAASAVSHDVYFGTDSNAVKTATHASPEFKGNQTETSYLVTGLNSLLTCYWRIDEVDASAAVTKGDVWMFRPRHLAFPGAEGYGRFARGGRGGVVVKVTNLNDSGPGSLRDAIEGDYGPRTIIFDVGGLITLESDLIISGNRPCITVAGQTAPGKGICIRKHQFGMSGARDIICRFLRIRVGDISGETQNGSGMAGVDHCIMDHCSISWGIDEEMSTRGAKNLTLQRVLISEALNIAGHDKYPPGTRHGYAASIGGDIASFHHNLLAHCEGRNWSLAGGLDGAGFFAGRLDIFNNVVYNWGGRTTDGGAHEVNFVNNYYKPGPASHHFRILTAQYENFPGTQRYYFVGNVMEGHYQTNQQEAARAYTGTPQGYEPWSDAPFFPSCAAIDGVTNAYKKVLSDVGCNQPQIDNHDTRVITETLNGTFTHYGSVSGDPGLPDSQNDVGGWENYPTVSRPPDWDTDNDGLPNWWEEIHGLHPDSAPGDFSDSHADPDGDGYTNLEDYLNWMAAPHFDCTNGIPLDIDLRWFARGFTNHSPVYSISAPINGSVTLLPDGFTARFTSQVSTNALGGFTFSVMDAQGHAMTNTIGLRLIASAAPAQPPLLGIRSAAGGLSLEITAEAGRDVVIQTATNLTDYWLDWTNLPGAGTTQLVPLNEITNAPLRYFRAVVR